MIIYVPKAVAPETKAANKNAVLMFAALLIECYGRGRLIGPNVGAIDGTVSAKVDELEISYL